MCDYEEDIYWYHDCYHTPKDAEEESTCYQCNLIYIDSLKKRIQDLVQDRCDYDCDSCRS